MHASLLISVLLLLFSRHVPAAPSNNMGLDDVGSWHTGDGTQSLASPPAVEITKDGITDVDIRNTTAFPPEMEQTTEKDKRGESGDYLDCRDLSQNKYLFRKTMISAVEKFCKDVQGRAHEKHTRGVSRTYDSGTPDEVNISVLPPFFLFLRLSL